MHPNDTRTDRFTGHQDPRAARLQRALAAYGPQLRGDDNDSAGGDHDGGGRRGHGPRSRGHEGRDFGPGGFGPRGFGPGGFGPGGFGPGGPRRGGGRRPGRGGRGDVRAAILVLLNEGPMHGYQLIQQIAERSGGVWTPSPGSVYPALSQLEDEGLVQLERVEGRNNASLTEAGTQYVSEHREELGSPWDEASGAVSSEAHDLRAEVRAVMAAAQQVSQVGTAAQVAEASRLLAEARKSLYRILAGDSAES